MYVRVCDITLVPFDATMVTDYYFLSPEPRHTPSNREEETLACLDEFTFYPPDVFLSEILNSRFYGDGPAKRWHPKIVRS